MPSNNKTTDPYVVTSWGSNEFDFTCPSGQTCRMRKIDPIQLVAEGLLGKLDFLTSIVLGEHLPNARMSAAEKAKAAKAKVGTAEMSQEAKDAAARAQAFQELTSDPKKFHDFSRIMDQMLLKAVVLPEIHDVPSDDQARVSGRIYVDSVDFNDKVAIFNRCLKGVTDLEQFRKTTSESVGPMARESNVSGSTK